MAVFGEKDYQQFLVIEEMVRQFSLGVRLYRGEIIREKSGLAMSSRNRYLGKEFRTKAYLLYNYLSLAKKKIVQGKQGLFDFAVFRDEVISLLKKEKIVVEYFEIRDSENLKPLKNDFSKGRIFLAAKVGDARLIDNLSLY